MSEPEKQALEAQWLRGSQADEKTKAVAEKVVEIINDSKLTESDKQHKVYHLITTLNPQ